MTIRTFLPLIAPLMLTLVALAQPPRSTAAEGAQLFEAKVRPVFAARCLACHKGAQAAAGLRLDTAEGWKGVVASGKLLKAIRHEPGATPMPPTGTKLSERELAGFVEWVKRGAPGPITLAKPDPRKHWAFQPLHLSPNPSPGRSSLTGKGESKGVEDLLEAKRKELGLSRSAPAPRSVWLRRVSFDLIGLPPTPDELSAFLADKAPGAEERVVERLLASPRFGEKWARHWLDLARFAESHGYEQDYDRPHAYTYRDFVIKAFNDDLPYDTFVKWQLAGDEFAPRNPQALFATGFLGAGTHATQITKSQVEKERYDELDDMLSVTSQAFLGLMVGCARCHDHKYDPIPQRDYYRMLATFTKTVRSDYDVALDTEGDKKKLTDWESAHAPLVAARAAWEQEKLPAKLAHWVATVSRKR
ncbi:DUF1549 domain-containing protein, partial [Armatimonas sp.]|uniref:DUF1549 domain-containing protein n=1 Tax=Armatimonas sp. TaxID=1872638 RepID=UPI00286D5471